VAENKKYFVRLFIEFEPTCNVIKKIIKTSFQRRSNVHQRRPAPVESKWNKNVIKHIKSDCEISTVDYGINKENEFGIKHRLSECSDFIFFFHIILWTRNSV